MKNTLLVFLAVVAGGCNACHNTTPLIPKDGTHENERKNRLFAFVGEKISVTAAPYETGTMDGKFTAKYKVLERVYGHYEKDTIEFTVYDRYGIPPFSTYKNVLLYVSEYKGKYFHEEYLYQDVYKTQNGRWAGSYDMEDYSHSYNKYTTVQPEKIDFIEEVSYPAIIKYTNGTEKELNFPEPYFKKVGDKAIAVYGNYIEELFKLKKEGVLTARGLFGDNPPEVIIQDVPLEEVTYTPSADDLKFIAFWKIFYKTIKAGNLQRVKQQALDSFRICDSLLPIDRLNKKYVTSVFNKKVLSKLKDSAAINYTHFRIGETYLFAAAKKEITKDEEGAYRLRGVDLIANGESDKETPFHIAFLPTNKGFKLFGFGYKERGRGCW